MEASLVALPEVNTSDLWGLIGHLTAVSSRAYAAMGCRTTDART
jgi:hypothetical protein